MQRTYGNHYSIYEQQHRIYQQDKEKTFQYTADSLSIISNLADQIRKYYCMYFDDEMFRCKNYFKTKEEAQKYADEIKDILNKREL